MLPPFIIEQIRKREQDAEEQRRDAERPRLEIPLDYPRPPRRERDDDVDGERDRGVVILDLG